MRVGIDKLESRSSNLGLDAMFSKIATLGLAAALLMWVTMEQGIKSAWPQPRAGLVAGTALDWLSEHGRWAG